MLHPVPSPKEIPTLMGQQVIQQPDGRFAVFSTVTETFIAIDATDEEIVSFFREEAAEKAEATARRSIAAAMGTGTKVLHPFYLSWEEAKARDAANQPPS